MVKQTLKRWFPRPAVRSISYLFGGNFFTYLSGFLYGIFAARILGPKDFGQLISIIALVKLTIVPFDLRVESPLVKLLGSTDNTNRRRNISTSVLLLHWTSLLLYGLIFFLLLVLLPDYWAIFRHWQIALGFYAVSEILLQGRLVQPFLQVQEQFGNLSVYKSVVSFFRNFVPIPFMFYGIQATCLGYLISEVILVIVTVSAALIVFGRRAMPAWKISLGEIKGHAVEIYHHTRSNYFAGIFKVAFHRSQELFIRHFIGSSEVGFFNVGMKFNRIFMFSARTIQPYLFPRLVKKWEDRKQEFFYTIRKYFVQGIVYYSLLAGLLCLAVPWLIPFVYGSAFGPAVPVALIVIPAIALNYLFSIGKATFFAVNRQRVIFNVYFLSALIGIPLTYGLLLRYSYLGVAVAFAGVKLITVTYYVYEFYRSFEWRWLIAGEKDRLDTTET